MREEDSFRSGSRGKFSDLGAAGADIEQYVYAGD